MIRILLLLLFLSSGHFAKAQELDSAFYYSNLERYELAWHHLKKAVESGKPLPDKAAFLHGKIMYHQGNYTEAKAGLSKYLELAGKDGEFSGSAIHILNLCEEQICVRCENTGYFFKDADCLKCDSTGRQEVPCNRCQEGIILCSSCNGRKFEKESTAMGVIYKDCSRCQGEGIIPCTVCEGEKVIKKICFTCHGTKKVKFKASCDH